MVTEVWRPSGRRRSAPCAPRRRSALARQQRRFAFIVMVPVLGGTFVFGLYPVGYVVWMSLHRYSLFSGSSHPFVGLQNYRMAVTSDYGSFWRAALQTLYYPLIRLPIEVVVAMAFAVALRRIRRGRQLYLAMIFLPAATSLTAMSIVFGVVFNSSTGIVNRLLDVLGVPSQLFLGSATQALPTVESVDIWHGLGFATVILFAGLLSIDQRYYEAAAVDGANAWQQFRTITLPLLRPVLSVVLILDSVYLLQLFTPILVMTEGGPFNSTLNLPYLIYESLTGGLLSYAAACSVMLFLLILVFVAVWNRLGRADT